MTRIRLPSTLVGLGLSALCLAACSMSFRAGSSSSAEAGKPAASSGTDDRPTAPTTKPIAKADPAPRDPAPSDPADDETTPADDPGPARQPPATEEPPGVEPRLTAVCRVEDPVLATLCHDVLDPIAADDLDAWLRQVGEGAVLVRPSHEAGMQRLRGTAALRELATDVGGLRAMLHLRPVDRVVGTVANDCRQCRRSLVTFEANTRSGTVVVGVEMAQPPRIVSVEVGAQVRRRHLGTAVQRRRAQDPVVEAPPSEPPPSEPPPSEPPPTVKPPAATEIVAPAPKEPAPPRRKKQDEP